jgi:hypothetical protein
MISRKSRPLLALVVAGVISAAFAAPGLPSAFAATKPKISTIALHDREFLAATAVVSGATGVAICISRRCRKAIKVGPSLWILNAAETPSLRKGQRREVIVFAVNAAAQFSFSAQRVTVR